MLVTRRLPLTDTVAVAVGAGVPVAVSVAVGVGVGVSVAVGSASARTVIVALASSLLSDVSSWIACVPALHPYTVISIARSSCCPDTPLMQLRLVLSPDPILNLTARLDGLKLCAVAVTDPPTDM